MSFRIFGFVVIIYRSKVSREWWIWSKSKTGDMDFILPCKPDLDGTPSDYNERWKRVIEIAK